MRQVGGSARAESIQQFVFVDAPLLAQSLSMNRSFNIGNLRVDVRFLVLGVILALTAFAVEGRFVSAVIGAGFAIVIVGCLPVPTRTTMAAAMLGMATCTNAFLSFATGVFQNPLVAEFGWTRSQYVVVLQIVSVSSILFLPATGWLIDRYGVRRVATPSFVFFALLLFGLSQMTGQLNELYAAYLLLPIIGAGATSIAFARLVTNWFDRKRGLALGAVLSGIGIGGAIFSPLTQAVIGAYGWRSGYQSIAAVELLVVVPLLWFFIKDHPAQLGLGKDGVPSNVATSGLAIPPPTGLTARESRRKPLFWLMVGTFMLLAFAVGGVFLQMFPILTAKGIDATRAASILGTMALSLIVGRTVAGALMDAFPARYVAAGFLVGPVIGSLMLANPVGETGAFVAAILFGLATGAEIDVLAYLVSRYFGVKAFATNYAWQYAAWNIGSGLGPQMSAMLFDRTHSYSLALYIDAAIFAVAALLVLTFGPFPDWNGPPDRVPVDDGRLVTAHS